VSRWRAGLHERASECTACLAIVENALALDPCSASDVNLLWFDPDGKPCCSKWKRQPNALDEQRVRTTVWLYHLNKREIEVRRGNHMRQIRTDLAHADAHYHIWNRDSVNPDSGQKQLRP
jgi:hypothetical protein